MKNGRRPTLLVARPNFRGMLEGEHAACMNSLASCLGREGYEWGLASPHHTILIAARQGCIDEAIARGCDLVLWIDDDMVFLPEHYFALEKELMENDLDYISGLFFTNGIPTKPCIFARNPEFEENGPQPWWHIVTRYPGYEKDEDKCRFEVCATGFGMVLMRTRMLDAMRRDELGRPIENYCHFLLDGKNMPHANEDVSFGLNARKHGFKVWCDTRVEIGHISKEKPIITEAIYRAQNGSEHYKLNAAPLEVTADSIDMKPIGDCENPSGKWPQCFICGQIVGEKDHLDQNVIGRHVAYPTYFAHRSCRPEDHVVADITSVNNPNPGSIDMKPISAHEQIDKELDLEPMEGVSGSERCHECLRLLRQTDDIVRRGEPDNYLYLHRRCALEAVDVPVMADCRPYVEISDV